jgi:hypothetical protein
MSIFSSTVRNEKLTNLTTSSTVYRFGRRPALPLAVPLGSWLAFRFVDMISL